jgi:hypothetical protein
MRKITLLLTLLLVFGYSGYAQVSAYSFAQSAGNYTPITGGTVYLTGTFDDGISQGVTIPSFNYNGVAYTTLKINANGHIAFGTYTSTTNYSPLSSSTNANGGIVAALGRDLNSAESGTPEIRYELIGNEFVIQYKDVRRYGVSAEVLNFQIRLNTTNNVVSIVYGGTITPGLNTSYPEIGLKGATNNFLTNINNRTIGAAGGSWLNSLPGTSNASTMYFNSANVTTVPAVGTTFTFTPPVPCSGTPVAGSVAPAVQNICTGSTPTQLVGTGYSSGVSGITFQWEESNDDGATDTWAIAVGGTGATTANYTPPVFASTIYYRLVVTCTNSTTSAQTTSVLVSTPSAPVTQASAVIAPIATINYAQAIVNWTNGSGARRVVYISDSATFADPVNNNAAALTSNTVFTGSGQQIIFDGTGASVTVTGLATDTQYYIKVYEYLRCGSGPYDYYYNVTTGTNIGTFTTCGVLTVPTLEDFTTYLPGCWQEADNGDLTAGPATFGTGAWVADGFGNVTAVGAIKINIDATGDNDWILSPLYTIPVTGYELKFDAAATQYNSTNTPTTAWEADDFVQVLVSTGTSSWTVLYTFNNTNVPSNTGTPTIIDLDAYSGQNVRFAFRAVEGATNGGADIDFSVDNFEIRLTPACVEPTTLVATNITATSVDLSWVDPSAIQFDFEYAIQAQGTGVPAGAGIAIGATSVVGDTSDLDGVAFTANTPYEVYVRADCGGGQYSTWLGPINFRTPCVAFSIPFSEGFNSTSTTEECWTVLNVNADSDLWNTNYTSNPFEGDQSAAIYTDGNSGSNNDWLITPALTLTGNQRLKFQYRVQSASEPNDYELLLSTTGKAPADFTNILITSTSYSNVTYVEQIIDISAYSGDVYIAWHIPSGGLDGWRFYIDNVIVEDIPTCLAPSTLATANITATSVDLSWVDPSATQFDFEYAIQPQGTGVPTGAGIAIGATSVVGATSDLDGVAFTANTPYEVYVRADCGGGDYSTWLGPINFRTLCSALSAPTTVETFNTFLPSCWTKTLGALTASSTLTGNSTAWVAVAGFGNTGANTASKINAYGGTVATPDNDWLISPAIDLGATAGLYRLKYKMAVTGYNGTSVQATLGTHQLRVVVSTDGGATWSDTNVIKTYTGAETYSNTGLDETILLTGYTGIVKIGFLVTTSSTSPDLDIHIDDFIVEAIPSCLEPSTLATANITATSVDLSWIDPSGTQFDFEYVIQAQGTGVPAGAGIAIGATLVTDSSLASNTAYEVYVRADCGGGSFSSWVGPVNFSTSINVLCGTPVNTTHCYSDNDATTWVFTSNDGSPLRITFNAGDMESCCDDILIYDGINNTGTLLYQGNNGGDLTGLVFDSTTDSIYVEIDSDGSVSCDNSGYVSIDFDIVCATCVSPTATFAVVADCANAQYFIDVDIITIGSANSLAISDGVTTLSADLSSGIQTFGPYANGASTTITVTNEQDASCSISSSVAYSCPPDNDECNDAIVLNVNADYLCGVTTSGTNVAATDSGVEPTLSVSGTSDNDVWFSFVAVQTAHRISLADKVAVVGTSVDMGIGVFSGTCSSLALVGSSDPDVYNVSGLTIGDTYLVNVYGWYSAGSNEAQVTFNICVGTDPTLSSSSFDSNAFLAYPNPVKDILNLEYNSEIASVRVLNLLGQEVISKTIKANATQVDMTPLSAGAYIVNVTVGDTVKTIKVVKQ